MGSSGGSQDSTIKYSPYLEKAHSDMLNHGGKDKTSLSVIEAFNSALGRSPYTEGPIIDDVTLFGTAAELWIYPSLFDIYGKFMAGLDVEGLWSQIYATMSQGVEVDTAIAIHSNILQDDIDSNVMPKLLAGYRDINSVVSSAFVTARALVQDSKLKAVSKFAADIRLKIFDLSVDRWKSHLEWNKQVTVAYGELVKLYISARMDIETTRLDFATKNRLWDLKLFEYVRAMLGAMQGAATTTGLNEPSQAQKSISGAMAGAALGAQIGGGYGAVAGAVVGTAASFIK